MKSNDLGYAILDRSTAPLSHDRRFSQARHAIGLALLILPAASACGGDPSCEATATCPPRPQDNAVSDAGFQPLDGAVSDGDTDIGASRDAGAFTDSPPRDSADGASDGGRDDAASRADSADVADDTRRGDAGRPDGSDRDGGNADRADPPADAASDDVGFSDAAGDSPFDAFLDVADEPSCDVSLGRSPLDEPCLIDEKYGVFVSPLGNDKTGSGTRAAPFQTINRGLYAAKASTGRVFVCDNGAGYANPIAVDASTDGVALYGSFDCARWLPSASAHARVQPQTGPALKVSGLTLGVTVENFELRATDAALGANSIAVEVNASIGIAFRRSRLLSGKGGAGAAGADGAPGPDGPAPGADQHGRAAFCSASSAQQPGGVGPASACGSRGGNGGIGSVALSGPYSSHRGDDGQPVSGVSSPNYANAGTACRNDTTRGAADGLGGSDGLAGASGMGTAGSGSFSSAGYTPVGPGGDGTDGTTAQGGGGGVGCPAASTCVGPSGGAGGAGGCGGFHGMGGGAGGASVALLSWRSVVTLDTCEIASSDGGKGGKGGNGGSGGKGGAGGDGNVGVDGSDPSGAGGPGGNGGSGAPGAGGNGGPTYGIVFAGERPSQVGAVTLARGAGGLGGAGGVTTSALPDAGTSRAADGWVGESNYELGIP